MKPMLICSTNGRIVDIYKPYPGSYYDAKILVDIMKEDIDLQSLIQKNDIFILDRGFRDCMEYLRIEQGMKSKLPTVKPSNGFGNPLTTSEANQSRCVTKIRYVVESTLGLLKY